MRTKRTIIAPALLTLGAVGSIVAGPIMAFTTAVAPSATAVTTVAASPNGIVYHA